MERYSREDTELAACDGQPSPAPFVPAYGARPGTARICLFFHPEGSPISHLSITFSGKEFNWDAELTKELNGANELIPWLSAFLFSFTEL